MHTDRAVPCFTSHAPMQKYLLVYEYTYTVDDILFILAYLCHTKPVKYILGWMQINWREWILLSAYSLFLNWKLAAWSGVYCIVWSDGMEVPASWCWSVHCCYCLLALHSIAWWLFFCMCSTYAVLICLWQSYFWTGLCTCICLLSMHKRGCYRPK